MDQTRTILRCLLLFLAMSCLYAQDSATTESPTTEETTSLTPEVTTSLTPEVTTSLTPEVTTSLTPEVTTSLTPEVTTSLTPEVTTPEVTTTESPTTEGTTSLTPEVTTPALTTTATSVKLTTVAATTPVRTSPQATPASCPLTTIATTTTLVTTRLTTTSLTTTTVPTTTGLVFTSLETTTPAITDTSGPETTVDGLTYLQSLLDDIFRDLKNPSDILEKLWKFTFIYNSTDYKDYEVEMIVYLLGNVTERYKELGLQFNVTTLQKLLHIADRLISDTTLGSGGSGYRNLGSHLFARLENTFSAFTFTNKSYNFTYKNIEFQSRAFRPDELRDEKLVKVNQKTNLSVSKNYTNYCPICSIIWLTIIIKPTNNLIKNQSEIDGESEPSHYVASRIQTNALIVNNKSVHITNISIAFQCGNNTCDNTAVCVYWDLSRREWSTKGCLTKVINGTTICNCSHLTTFSVLMTDSIPEGNIHALILEYIGNIGLPISIVSLILCILIQGILIKNVTNIIAYYRHVTIIHIAVFLLISNISFITSSFIKPSSQVALCGALTFLTHFSLLAFFCWTLVQGLYLVCRLVFVFHHVTKREFLALSIVLGYVCPLAIAAGTFLEYFPDKYRKNNACWLNGSSGAAMFFFIPAVVIMSGNVLVLIVVISKVIRPSISEGNSEDAEVLKKLMKVLLFCTPQFGLTWAVGIPMYIYPSVMFLQYMFVVLNPLQGFFLFLFGCLLDKKVLELVKKALGMESARSDSVKRTVDSTT